MRSSFRNACPGVPIMRSTSEINAELVDIADATKTAPKSLLRDHRGILVAANSTPV
jgi:hypothetical protein